MLSESRSDPSKIPRFPMDYAADYPSCPESTVTEQPTLHMVHGYKVTPWSSKTYDCCIDKNICLGATFCAPCVSCQLASDFGECCFLPMVPGSVVALRSAMRERFHIQGSIADDFLMLTFLGSCTLCQMMREMKYRSKMPGALQIVRGRVEQPRHDQQPHHEHQPHYKEQRGHEHPEPSLGY